MCSLSRIALRLPSSALHLPCLQSLPVSTLCGDSVLSVPVMSQHMDAYLRFQGSGPGYQKAQSVQAKIKIKGFFYGNQESQLSKFALEHTVPVLWEIPS